MSRGRWLGIALTVALGAGPAPADPGQDPPRVAAWGSVAWLDEPDLDLLGRLGLRVPWRVSSRSSGYLAIDTQTVIRKSIGDFTFQVRELNYTAEAGIRRRLRSGHHLTLFAGQRGQDGVDAARRAFFRHAAVGIESAAPGRARLSWSAALGPVFEDRDVEAQAFLRGTLRLRLPFGAATRRGYGFAAELDSLLEAGELDADLVLGPDLWWAVSSTHSLSLFLHYTRHDHPLGPRFRGVIAGLRFEERGPLAGRPHTPARAPEIQGRLAAGAGGGREAGRLVLDFDFPLFSEHAGWISAEFDVNVLTGEDTDELYYFYRVGYERPWLAGQGGIYFYHRSNHQLDEPNDRITSINVLEAGWRSSGWNDDGRDGIGRVSRLVPAVDAGLGWLLTSSFGEKRRWHARLGLRWWLGHGAGPTPLLELDLEEGDVGRRAYAAGMGWPGGTALKLEYRIDEQFFGGDRTALLLLGQRRFD